MKTKLFLLVLLASVALFQFNGCYWHDRWATEAEYDETPPSAPFNLRVQNGDQEVTISWSYHSTSDLAGFNVYESDSYNGKYYLLGSTTQSHFVHTGARNGKTYYYAVAAYDYNDNESDLSKDVIYSTPRPEGYNQAIFESSRNANNSGYDFSAYKVVAFDDNNADFYYQVTNGQAFLKVYTDTDIQDLGYAYSLYDNPTAPTSGWSATKSAALQANHMYIVWTWDNHYAKIYVKSISSDRIIFDWVYQTVPGNIELKNVTKNRILSIKNASSR